MGLLTHLRTAPYYKLAQSFVEEEQKNMIANEDEKEKATMVRIIS